MNPELCIEVLFKSIFEQPSRARQRLMMREIRLNRRYFEF